MVIQVLFVAMVKLDFEDEQLLLDELCQLEDIQCAWTLLSWCAVPRSNHLIRVVPPSLSNVYAVEHDRRIWKCLCGILGTPDQEDDALAKQIASVPGRLGGLGLRSAERNREGAFLASWFDALPILENKLPNLARNISAHLTIRVMPCTWSLYEVITKRWDFITVVGRRA